MRACVCVYVQVCVCVCVCVCVQVCVPVCVQVLMCVVGGVACTGEPTHSLTRSRWAGGRSRGGDGGKASVDASTTHAHAGASARNQDGLGGEPGVKTGGKGVWMGMRLPFPSKMTKSESSSEAVHPTPRAWPGPGPLSARIRSGLTPPRFRTPPLPPPPPPPVLGARPVLRPVLRSVRDAAGASGGSGGGARCEARELVPRGLAPRLLRRPLAAAGRRGVRGPAASRNCCRFSLRRSVRRIFAFRVLTTRPVRTQCRLLAARVSRRSAALSRFGAQPVRACAFDIYTSLHKRFTNADLRKIPNYLVCLRAGEETLAQMQRWERGGMTSHPHFPANAF